MRLRRGLAIGLLLALAAATPAAAFTPYESYNYNAWGESVPMPATYEVEQVADGTAIGAGELKAPADLFAAGENVYILDAGNGRVLVTDTQLRLQRTLENPDFVGGAGLFVDGQGALYVANKDAGKIIRTDKDGKTLSAFGKPVGEEIPDSLDFKPVKVAAGLEDSLYIVCEGSSQGIMETDYQGNSLGFYGSNRVEASQIDLFWRRLFSKEQRENTKNIVPIEYASLDIDGAGFVYAVTAESKNSQYEIKKLDPKGMNILRVRAAEDMVPGVKLNMGDYGDLEVSYERGQKTDTRFVDIKADDDGFLYALDGQRGRVFQYDNDSNLLCVFGDMGEQTGTFRRPVSVESLGDRVLVLDSEKGNVTVFRPTTLGGTIRQAVSLYNRGLYEQSKEVWLRVNRMSTNYELAYTGLGKALYNEGDFAGAMKYYKLAYDKRGYDDAYTEYRKEFIRGHFGWLLLALAAGIALLAVGVRQIRKRHPLARVFRGERYLPVGYYLTKPFKASDDVRMMDQGGIGAAAVIMALLVLSRIVSMGMTGFLFNNQRLENIQAGQEILLIFALYGGFVLCNWAVSTLVGGEGRRRDVAVVAGYSFVPMVVGNLVCAVLSNGLTLRESGILGIVSAAATAYSFILLFIGVMTVHRLTALGAAANILLTLVGMLLLLFLLVLVYGLTSQMVVFIQNILTEILYRV